MNFNKKISLVSLRNSMVLLFCISLFSTSITFGWTRDDEILFWNAIRKGDTAEVIKLVTEKSLDVNASAHDDGIGTVTPLVVALKHHDVEMVKTLLNLGADPNRHYGYGSMTPLLALLIFEGGISYEEQTAEVKNKILALVKILLDHGADPDDKNGRGTTPLLAAISNNLSIDIIKLLLEHGADPQTRDCCGLKATDSTSNKAILEALAKAISRPTSAVTNPTGSSDGSSSGLAAASAATGNPGSSQSDIGQPENPSGSITPPRGKKRPLEGEDNNLGDDVDNGDEEAFGGGSLSDFADLILGTGRFKVVPDAEPNHKKARTRYQGLGAAVESSTATSFGFTAMGAAGGGGASSSSSSSAAIGPNQIAGYELIEVPGGGNRFFAAVADRLLAAGHGIMQGLHRGAGQTPEDLLLSRLPVNENDIARVTTILNDIYIAVIDTRNPHAGFTYYHQGRQLNRGERATSTTGHPVIMLAFNGAYYLVVNIVSTYSGLSLRLGSGGGPRPRPPRGPGGSGAGFGASSSSLKNTFG
jgi:hypothetical protein